MSGGIEGGGARHCCTPTDARSHSRSLPQVVTAPTLATLGVVAAILDGASIRYAHAMIPFNILAVFEFMGIIGMCVIFCKATNSEDRRISSALGCALTVMFVLSLVAEAGPARSEDQGNGLPADLIVIPIAIGAAVVALLWCVLSIFLCCRARRDTFTDLYNFEWVRWRARAPALPGGVAAGAP